MKGAGKHPDFSFTNSSNKCFIFKIILDLQKNIQRQYMGFPHKLHQVSPNINKQDCGRSPLTNPQTWLGCHQFTTNVLPLFQNPREDTVLHLVFTSCCHFFSQRFPKTEIGQRPAERGQMQPVQRKSTHSIRYTGKGRMGQGGQTVTRGACRMMPSLFVHRCLEASYTQLILLSLY